MYSQESGDQEKEKKKAYFVYETWTLSKEKNTCIDWLGSEIELERMCSRLG